MFFGVANGVHLLMIWAAARTTSAAMGLYPQPEGADSCSVEGHILNPGETITPTEGPNACTRISCSRAAEDTASPPNSNNNGIDESDENNEAPSNKLYGEIATCEISVIDSKYLTPELKEELLEQNEAKRKLPYPECCVPNIQ